MDDFSDPMGTESQNHKEPDKKIHDMYECVRSRIYRDMITGDVEDIKQQICIYIYLDLHIYIYI